MVQKKHQNALANETSPYLLQHKNNPVDWLPWGEEAFQKAKKRDVPVIVSIGYSTCHWCHVMEHEVFEDEEIAALMNEYFVSVKVDREEHPDVDEIYMDAIHAMRQRGGWPLNVFVTPEGKPFFGGTYFPAEYWKKILLSFHEAWKKERDKIQQVAAHYHTYLQQERDFSAGEISSAVWKSLGNSLRQSYDKENPAWGEAPKFPPSQLLRLVLLLKKENIGEDVKEQALNILTAMQDSGLHDLIGGGFHRYSTDDQWRVPHFEKMLYDNALLAVAYLLAGKEYQRQDLLHTGKRILDYLLRDMRIEKEGQFMGYAAAEDADDPGGEGSFYAWSPEDLKKVLGEEVGSQLAQEWNIWQDQAHKNHLGHLEPITGHIPFPRGGAMKGEPADQKAIAKRLSWEKHYPKLLEARSQRPRPGRDYKVLTGWNGLALSAFAHGACLTGEAKYYQATEELAEALVRRHQSDGLRRLPHIAGYLNDYGFLLCGLIDAYDALGNPQLITQAEAIAQEAIDKFAHPEGGFYSTAANREDLITRKRNLFDNAYPSGNSAMALGLARLWSVTEKSQYQQHSFKTIESMSALARSEANMALPTLLTGYLALARSPLTWVVTGKQEDHQQLLQACREQDKSSLAVIVDAAKAEQQDWPCLESRRNLEETMALVCAGQTCLAPARSAQECQKRREELQKMLEQ